MTHTVQLHFIRQEKREVLMGKLDIELTSDTARDIHDKAPEEGETAEDHAMQRLTTALTEWVKHDTAARQIWHRDTCQDLNVGDISTYGLDQDASLTPYLAAQGITGMTVDIMGGDDAFTFDRVLVDRSEIEDHELAESAGAE